MESQEKAVYPEDFRGLAVSAKRNKGMETQQKKKKAVDKEA